MEPAKGVSLRSRAAVSRHTYNKAPVSSAVPSEFSGLPAAVNAPVLGARHVTLGLVSKVGYSWVLVRAVSSDLRVPAVLLIVLEHGAGGVKMLNGVRVSQELLPPYEGNFLGLLGTYLSTTWK